MTGLRPLCLALGFVLSAPAAASAASLRPLAGCYVHGTEARVAASGYEPGSRLDLTLAGEVLGTAETDGTGAARLTINLAGLPRGVGQRSLLLRGTDASGTSAETRLHVTRRRAVFAAPTSSTNVRTWRAVFRLFGFRRGAAYLHWVNPQGRLVKTVRLGALRQPCGRLRTGRRRVLPFANPEYGVWRLQFDTRRRYARRTANRRVIRLRVSRGA